MNITFKKKIHPRLDLSIKLVQKQVRNFYQTKKTEDIGSDEFWSEIWDNKTFVLASNTNESGTNMLH